MDKVFLIVIDGLGDRPIPAFGRKTPLEAAKTPNLDKLARGGISGVMHTIDIGVRPGSDTALFGYDPKTYYTGRGPFEVAGINMEVRPGDVCLRVNMGTVDDNLVVVDRRAGRIDDTNPFAKKFNGTVVDGVKFLVKAGTGHRLGIIMRGKGLSSQISSADPKELGVKLKTVEGLDASKEAKFTARVLNKFLLKVYKEIKDWPLNKQRVKVGKLPANFMLARGAGVYPELPSFFDKYGLKAACIAGAGLYKGVAKILGMEVIDVPGATGKPDSDVAAKIKKAIKATHKFDFIFVHIKGADTLGEDGNPEGKKAFIEKVDQAVAPLSKLKKSLVVVTADHSTPCALKNHSADDVPITIFGESVRDDDVEAFGERACAKGRLGRIRGEHLMPIIIDLMGLAQMFGA